MKETIFLNFLIYESLEQNYILRHLKAALKDQDLKNQIEGRDATKNAYSFIIELIKEAEKRELCGDILKEYVFLLLLESENIFSLRCERNMTINSSLEKLVLRDLEIATALCEIDLTEIENKLLLGFSIKNYAPENVKKANTNFSAKEIYKALCSFYRKHGCGIINRYAMLKISVSNTELSLEGIDNSDPVLLDDLIGYSSQKKSLLENAKAFTQGLPSHNVLLVGARGTGKSSSVKAVANELFDEGLRLVELSHSQLEYIPQLCKILSNRGKYFIIYIDDLSFDESDSNYKALKSMLEGGVEVTPNVRFYVTSNRRHLIREKFSDRQEEVHEGDTMNEKISLSDRFGLTLYYLQPNQQLYLEIVQGIAKKNGIQLEEADKIKAIQWELTNNGRSGRLAKQFVDNFRKEGLTK